ncbi:MAG: hypothetical protein EHM48_06820 [Planctomycetaceae bacterium]|nr:MAG: hypothetical protein EHM48_06820 [Planctomycetaceae bacterium]
MTFDTRRKRLLDRQQAAKVGRRYHAFYQGYQAKRMSRPGNPFKTGSEDHKSWLAGWQYAESEQSQESTQPVCQFGPGGDFATDWPEELS